MSTLKKPVLRGFVAASQARHLFIGGFLGLSLALSYKYFVALPKQRKYAEFYKTYDPEKSYKRMREAGLIRTFQDQEN